MFPHELDLVKADGERGHPSYVKQIKKKLTRSPFGGKKKLKKWHRKLLLDQDWHPRLLD